MEKQRLQFARFYFVGDEDLLEMIGNSRDVSTVMRHMIKMFAGVAAMEGEGEVTGLVSREGERVTFEPISINDTIIGWLSKVELGGEGDSFSKMYELVVEAKPGRRRRPHYPGWWTGVSAPWTSRVLAEQRFTSARRGSYRSYLTLGVCLGVC